MKIPSVAWDGMAWYYCAVVFAVVDLHGCHDDGGGERWNTRRDAVVWRPRRMSTKLSFRLLWMAMKDERSLHVAVVVAADNTVAVAGSHDGNAMMTMTTRPP